jgi:ribosomal protein S18 acetylase RimI-like enzyme
MAWSDACLIRTARIEDAPRLASMHVASWRETYVGILPDAMLAALSVERRTAMWEQIMRSPASSDSTAVYLASVDEELVGFGSCGGQRTDSLRAGGYGGEVGAIYVLRAFQRRGIGARLLGSMASDLITRGLTAASLWVLRDNPVARRFYERHGAQVIAEREDVRGDAVLVELAYGWADLTRLSGSLDRNL